MAEAVKRVRRSPEERAALIDEKIKDIQADIDRYEGKKAEYNKKIATAKAKISALEAQKKGILTPKPPRKTKRQKIVEMVRLAEKSGLKMDEIASRLNIELPK